MKNPLIATARQRNYVLIGLLVALFSTFLPAVNIVFIGSFSVAGYDGYGVAVVILLILSMIITFFDEEILALVNKKTEANLSKNAVIFVVSAIAVAIMLGLFYTWTQVVFNSDIRQAEEMLTISVNGKKNFVTTGVGLYFTFLSLAFVLWAIFAFPNLEKTCEIILDKAKNLKNNSQNSENNSQKTEEKTENEEKISKNEENNSSNSENAK